MAELEQNTFDDSITKSIFGEIPPGSEFEQLAKFIQNFPHFKRSDLRDKDKLEYIVSKYNFNEASIFGHINSNVADLAITLSKNSTVTFEDYYKLLNRILPANDRAKLISSEVKERKDVAELTMGEPFAYMLSRASKDYRPAIIFNLPNQLFYGNANEKITYYELLILMRLASALEEIPFPIIFLFDDETELMDVRSEEEKREADLKERREVRDAERAREARSKNFMKSIANGEFNNKDE